MWCVALRRSFCCARRIQLSSLLTPVARPLVPPPYVAVEPRDARTADAEGEAERRCHRACPEAVSRRCLEDGQMQCRRDSDTFRSASRSYASEEPIRRLSDTYQTPIRHLSDTYQTPIFYSKHASATQKGFHHSKSLVKPHFPFYCKK